MDIDFVFPVMTDGTTNLWLPDAKKKKSGGAWASPRPVSEIAFIEGLAEELRNAGKTVAFLTTTKPVAARLRQKFEHVFDLYDGLVRRRQVPVEECWAVERRYRLTSLRSFVYPEHLYDWGLDYDDLIPRAVHVLGWLERFVTQHRVRAFVNNVGGEVLRRSIGAVAGAHGIDNVIFDFAPIPGRFVLASSERGLRVPRLPDESSPEDVAFATEYVDSMLHNRKPWMPASRLGFGAANFKGAFKFLGTARHYEDVSVRHLVDERVRRVVRRVAGAALWRPADLTERFIFFPLNLPNDTSLTVRAPEFQRHDELVHYIADRVLPAGVKLYVKPHIGARDSFPIDGLFRAGRHPNVRLVAPTTNPHDLLEKALVTLVVNSTAGFESILHGKPTVVLGKPWYSGQGLTIDVEKLAELPDAVERALSFTPSRERLISFLGQYRHHTHEGIYGLPEPENMARIAKILLARARSKARPESGDPREQVLGSTG